MQKGRKYFSVFIGFLVVSAIIFGLSKTNIFSTPASIVSSIFSPIQSNFWHFTIGIKSYNKRNLKTGFAVVFKDNLIGKIGIVTPNLSQVILITNNESSFTAVTGIDKNVL